MKKAFKWSSFPRNNGWLCSSVTHDAFTRSNLHRNIITPSQQPAPAVIYTYIYIIVSRCYCGSSLPAFQPSSLPANQLHARIGCCFRMQWTDSWRRQCWLHDHLSLTHTHTHTRSIMSSSKWFRNLQWGPFSQNSAWIFSHWSSN